MKRPTLLFICLFAISAALQAVTFKEDTKIGGVCGQPVHVTIAKHALAAGAMDLDLRPAPESLLGIACRTHEKGCGQKDYFLHIESINCSVTIPGQDSLNLP